MPTAELVQEALCQFAPVTNLYACSDGKYLLVTVPKFDSLGTLDQTLGIRFSRQTKFHHRPVPAVVFLSDENGVVLDADENPANGMTPLAQIDECDSHEAALAAVGYQLA